MQASEASSPLACGEPEAERIRSPKKKDMFFLQLGCFCLSQHDLIAFVPVICPPDSGQENRSPSLFRERLMASRVVTGWKRPVWPHLEHKPRGGGLNLRGRNREVAISAMGQEGKRDEGGAWGGDPGSPQHLVSLARPPLEAACAVQMEHLRLIPWSRAWALGTEPGLGTWRHHFLPVSTWTSYFILHLSVSVSLSLKYSNTYLIRPLEGWELSENAYKMLRTLSGI